MTFFHGMPVMPVAKVKRASALQGIASALALVTAVPTVARLFSHDEPYLLIPGVLFVAPLQAIGGTVMADRSGRRPGG